MAHTALNSRHHVCNQDPMGPSPRRRHHRARIPMGGDTMDRMGAWLPSAVGSAVVQARQLANLPAARLLFMVVLVRRLRAASVPGRRLYRGFRRFRLDHRRHRHVGMAGAGGEVGHDLWLGPVGNLERGARCRIARGRWRAARSVRRTLPPAHRTRTRPHLRADALRQGRRFGRANTAHLGRFGCSPRYQGRELDIDGWMAKPLQPRLSVRSNQPAKPRLQSAA